MLMCSQLNAHHLFIPRPELIPAFKDLTLDKLAGSTTAAAAPAPPQVPGSSYPAHMKVLVVGHK